MHAECCKWSAHVYNLLILAVCTKPMNRLWRLWSSFWFLLSGITSLVSHFDWFPFLWREILLNPVLHKQEAHISCQQEYKLPFIFFIVCVFRPDWCTHLLFERINSFWRSLTPQIGTKDFHRNSSQPQILLNKKVCMTWMMWLTNYKSVLEITF